MVRTKTRFVSFLAVFSTLLLAQQSERIEVNVVPRWAVSGYLENGEKTYVVISNQKIERLSSEVPSEIPTEKILETNDWISPGFIDLHNHLGYNVLPLWENAQGQFDNRFEWRDMKVKKVVGYDVATTLQMEPFNPRPASLSAEQKLARERALCAGIRWAEIKALVGGATLIQGFMGESMNFTDTVRADNGETRTLRERILCAASFLIPNLEIQADTPELPLFDSKTDLVDDLASWGMNEPIIYPRMEAEGISYDEAVKKVLEEEKLFSWIKDFNTYPRSVSNGLRLALGKELPAEWTWLENFEDPATIPLRSELEAHSEDIFNYFVNVRGYIDADARPNRIDRDVKEVISWIYGPLSSASTSFLNSKAETDSERNAYEQLARAGIHSMRFIVREFAVDFYNRIYLPIQRKRSQQDNYRLIAHLSEGSSKHAFTQREFKDVVKMGLAYEKSIFIHGVGLDDEDLNYAKEKDLSFVWSPLSNLLLYNETLNVPAFLKKGINISLSPDWVVSGSKSVLFELKAARILFDKWIQQGKLESFSNKDLVQLVTQNPAKALSMEEHLGKVAPNFYANLLIVKKQSSNMYDDILKSTENDLKLIVINGLARSGETEWMEQILSEEKNHLEELSLFSPNQCIANKSIYLKDPNPLDAKLLQRSEEKLERLEVISRTVHEARAQQRQNASNANRAKLKDIDPLFDCDSPQARERLNQVASLALPSDSQSLAEQQEKRKALRNNPDQFLGDAWQSKYKK